MVLEIKRIEIRLLEIPLKESYHLSYTVLKATSPVVLRIETVNGLIGFGEADPFHPFTSVTSQDIYDELCSVSKKLLGREFSSVSDIQKIEEELISENLHSMSVGAIDMALLDLLSSSKDIPLYKLFTSSPKHERISVLFPLGNQGVEDDIRCVKQKMKLGYKYFMLKAGKGEINKHIDRVLKLSELFGDQGVFLCLDPNQAWNLEETNLFVREVVKDQVKCLRFLEQPMSRDKIVEYNKIEPVGMKISLDESIQTLEDYEKVSKVYKPDIIALKVSKNGGILNTMKLIDQMEEDGVHCLFNSMIETGITQAASLNIAMGTSNLFDFGHAFMSTHRLKFDITTFGELFEDGQLGRVKCPTLPGLGIKIDADALMEATVKKCEVM